MEDKKLFNLIDLEKRRQTEGIELIASEIMLQMKLWLRLEVFSQINMQKGYQEKGIMVVAL